MIRLRFLPFVFSSLLLLGFAHRSPAQISVSLPDLTGLVAGSTVDIPIRIDEEITSDDGIASFEFTVSYDASLLDITGVRDAGTLSEGWNPSFNSGTGEISVAAAATTNLTGGPGVLLYLQATLSSDVAGNSPLTFTAFQFNEDDPTSTTVNGNASVGNRLVLSEIHADPADGNPGDANGDGSRSATKDEFVEIINTGDSAIDIGEYTLFDETGVRFTVPSGTTLPPGVAAVVFGGGTPTNIPGVVFTAGSLGLNNGGDTVTLRDASGNPATAVTYGSEAGDDQSVTRNPDFSGPFVPHTEATDPDTPYSPGRMTNGGALPVELTSFEALRDGRAVVLRWTTASETNNSGFAVQRRVNGTFQKMAFVKGAGTTTSISRYQYRIAALPAGRHVFRLKQIDFDGTISYSRSVEVSVLLRDAFLLEPAAPNPFRNRAAALLQVRETQHVTVSLYNILGQRIRTIFRGTIRAGTPVRLPIDGQDLPSGLYLYRVEGRSFSTSGRITRVK